MPCQEWKVVGWDSWDMQALLARVHALPCVPVLPTVRRHCEPLRILLGMSACSHCVLQRDQAALTPQA